MGIPEDPLERRKWMLKLWREDYGARFSIFDPDDQPAPELGSWQPDMWEPYDPKPDQEGNYDPKVIKHVRWFEQTKAIPPGSISDKHWNRSILRLQGNAAARGAFRRRLHLRKNACGT